jgi:hypothetical protein
MLVHRNRKTVSPKTGKENVMSNNEIDLSQSVQEPVAESVSAEVIKSAKATVERAKSASELHATAATDTTKQAVASTMPALLDPAVVGFMNSMIREAVTAALSAQASASAANNAALLEQIAKLKEPSAKEKLELETIEKFRERERRERAQSQLQDVDARANLLTKQRSCSHRDGNEKSSISTVHNFPDRQVRGICVQCQRLIQPKRYEVTSPSVAFGSLENAKEYCSLLERENGYPRDSVQIYTDPRTGYHSHMLLPADPDYPRVIEQEKRAGMAVA